MFSPFRLVPSSRRRAVCRFYQNRAVRLGLACLTCATLVSLPSVAQAGTSGAEEITFQEGLVPDNGAITDQYQATYGVEFGSSSSLGFPGTAPNDRECGPSLLTDGYTAPGATAVAVLLARSAGESGCAQGEFYDPAQGFMFHMDNARASLSFMLLASASPGDHTPSSDISAEVVAYGSGGTVLDDVDLTSADATRWSTVSLSTNDPGGIQFVEVLGDISINGPVGVQIDNLALPAAIDYLPPGFSLARSSQPERGTWSKATLWACLSRSSVRTGQLVQSRSRPRRAIAPFLATSALTRPRRGNQRTRSCWSSRPGPARPASKSR